MYYLHPSTKLNELFAKRPFQGADPMKAKFVFIGLDANYDTSIETNGIFDELVEYLADGVNFWSKYGVHHPFLLPKYKGDGKLYHRNFSKIGFTKLNAPDVSFIEILHLPTYGRSDLKPEDLNQDHLLFLNHMILNGDAMYIFISPKVANLMSKTTIFTWLPKKPIEINSSLKLWYSCEDKKVFWHYHFSNYGKFMATLQNQFKDIGELITET